MRFTAPEFTSICPVTGQPDFGVLVLDYAPKDWIVESKSLKLFLQSFRNHGAFHETRTLDVGLLRDRRHRAHLVAHRRLLESARWHADRWVLANWCAAGRALWLLGIRAWRRIEPGLGRLIRARLLQRKAVAEDHGRKCERGHREHQYGGDRREFPFRPQVSLILPAHADNLSDAAARSLSEIKLPRCLPNAT
ncbi:MAG: hypothetical protein R3C16_13330 [Hyphomonadaceae bacterium]